MQRANAFWKNDQARELGKGVTEKAPRLLLGSLPEAKTFIGRMIMEMSFLPPRQGGIGHDAVALGELPARPSSQTMCCFE